MRKIGLVAMTGPERNRKHYAKYRDKRLAYNKKYYETYYPENAERIKRERRNRLYSITQEWFDNKLAEQNNCCAVCERQFTDTPHVDHDHKCCSSRRTCGKCNRGLLCTFCNVMIGMSKESEESLVKAIQYLKKYERTNE